MEGIKAWNVKKLMVGSYGGRSYFQRTLNSERGKTEIITPRSSNE